MLILSRKPGESVTIGPSVVITVLGVQGEKVRLGIAAPDDIAVWRSELLADTVEMPARRVCCT